MALKPLAIVSLHASPVAALGAGENGGMNVYIRAVCEELSRRGIPTEVFTRRTNPDGVDRVRLAEKSWVTRLAVGSLICFRISPKQSCARSAGAAPNTA